MTPASTAGCSPSATAPGIAVPREPRPPVTPDGRYLVVRGRLWRLARPDLPPQEREAHVQALMRARRDVGAAKKAEDSALLADARHRVQAAKEALGERGPVWWTDGTPDYNRRMAVNTPYRAWYESLDSEQRDE